MRVIVSVLLALVVVAAGAEEKRVVASTTWTAALALAAGARDVVVIAPAEMRHPPEFEPRPSDLLALAKADLVVIAGYERFAQRMAEAAGASNKKVLRINTVNDPALIIAEARRVAEALGTEDRFNAWVPAFSHLAEEIRRELAAAFAGRPVVYQRFLGPTITWLGLSVAGDFGPGEPGPATVARLAAAKPVLVIDNHHNPSGGPISEAARAGRVLLLNFPGHSGTRTIEDVFRYNAAQLRAGLARR